MNKHYNHINIGHWNTHGPTEKVNNSSINKFLDSEFAKVFEKLNLFCLSETHIALAQTSMLCFKTTIFIKVAESSVLTTDCLKNSHQDIIWLKLRKEFF